MVKISNSDAQIRSRIMSQPNEKIQIFPQKSSTPNYNKCPNQMNKLTKTIMSPLTTMPAQKMIVISSNNNNNIQRTSYAVNSPHQHHSKENPNLRTLQNQQTKNSDSLSKNLESAYSFIQQNDSKNIVGNIAVADNKNSFENNNNVDQSCKSNTSGKILLGALHPYICCSLCSGYLIKATTIVECLHTFCHSCLMKHLSREKQCPQCNMNIIKSKTNIKYDATIQSIVYKLVPGLYQKELLRRRAFYKDRPELARFVTGEERGDDTEHLIISPLDLISISLDYAEKENLCSDSFKENLDTLLKPKFLNCPAVFRIEHLKKFLSNKFNINTRKFNVEISYKVKAIVLPEHYTLMDVAYIYTWKKEAPMAFFYRIVRKCLLNNELPEISLRRSPPTPLINASKIEKECKIVTPSSLLQSEKNGIKNIRSHYSNMNSSLQVEPIKIKLSVSKNNVSIIHNQFSMGSKKEKSSEGLASAIPTLGAKAKENENESSQSTKKDEYDFEDELEQKKLGFLNTFQLTAKKNLNGQVKNVKDGKSNDVVPVPSIAVKRKSKDAEDSHPEVSKKSKTVETKRSGFPNKFMFTKTAVTKTTDGHEITFDMSPKPLGFKPTLEEVKNDIMMAKKAMDAKAHVKVDAPKNSAAEKTLKDSTLKKPKKLPLLLPKNAASYKELKTGDGKNMMQSTSPTAFIIKKPLEKKDFPSSKEISVTKIDDPNQHLKVYGPKTTTASPQERENSMNESKTIGGFVQPLPPKPKMMTPPLFNCNSPKSPANSRFLTGKINAPLQLYACRTPFYVPSSPNYTPNFDSKTQFKYANPNAYASFMQTMFSSPNSEKVPLSNNETISSDITGKRQGESSASPSHALKRAASPVASNDGESSKTLSILNNINFPSSLSVTLTNEQEENKKEQMRTCKQNIVNNNIEIIKIRDDKERKLNFPSMTVPQQQLNDEKVPISLHEDKEKQLLVVPSPQKNSFIKKEDNAAMKPPISNSINVKVKDPKESFQKAFLDSIRSTGKELLNNNNNNSSPNVKKRVSSPIKSDASESKKSLSEGEAKMNIYTKADCNLPPPSNSIMNSKQVKEKMPGLIKSSSSPTSRQDPSVLANAAMQHLMLSYAYPDLAQLQKTLMLETFRQNLALHQLQQQQKVQQQKSVSSKDQQLSTIHNEKSPKNIEKKE